MESRNRATGAACALLLIKATRDVYKERSRLRRQGFVRKVETFIKQIRSEQE